MDDQIRKEFWEELKLLQSIINKFDDLSFRVKNWFITVYVAITGYAIVYEKPYLLIFNFAIIFMFYSYEITHRISQEDFLRRIREVQNILRQDIDVNEQDKPPFMDKYVLKTDEISHDDWLLKIQKFLKIKEDRARKNKRDFYLIFKNSVRYLFQFRISLLYLSVIVVNIIVLILSFYS